MTGKLERMFSQWRTLRDGAIVHRLKMERASQHYHRHLFLNTWLSWRQAVTLNIRKRVSDVTAVKAIVELTLGCNMSTIKCLFDIVYS